MILSSRNEDVVRSTVGVGKRVLAVVLCKLPSELLTFCWPTGLGIALTRSLGTRDCSFGTQNEQLDTTPVRNVDSCSDDHRRKTELSLEVDAGRSTSKSLKKYIRRGKQGLSLGRLAVEAQ